MGTPIYKLLPWPRHGQSSSGPTSRARAAGDPRPQGAGRRGAPLHLPPARHRRGSGRDADGRRREHLHRLRRGVGCMNVGHSHPRVVEAIRKRRSGSPTPTSRSSRTRTTSAWPSACSSSSDLGREASRLLQLGRRGDRELDQVRPRLHEAAGGDRLRGGLPRADAARAQPHVEDAPVQGGPRPFAPETYRLPFDDLDALEYAFKTRVAAEDVAAIVIERCRARRLHRPVHRVRARAPADLRRARHRPGRGRGADRLCRTGRTFAIEHFGIEPDLVAIAKSIAAGLPALGRARTAEIMRPATAPSAAPTSATRSRSRPPTPCST